MNLDNPTIDNMTKILDQLADHFRVANRALFDPEDYDINKYDQLKFLYDMVIRQGRLSAADTQAFLDELRLIRKN
ncbi:DUF1128 domain-containing protein [Virgibacillus soli]